MQVYSYLAWMYDRIEAYDIAEDLLNLLLIAKLIQEMRFGFILNWDIA